MTSGYLLGFGTRDFPMEEQRRQNVRPASELRLGSMFYEVALLLQRPL